MTVSWLDKAVAVFAPVTATRRALARQAFDGLARGYDGASKGRRTDGWTSSYPRFIWNQLCS